MRKEHSLTQAIIEFFRSLFHNDIATVIVISMIPMIELRGAIPVGVAAGMNLFESFAWAWIGSSIVAVPLLLLLRLVLNWLKRFRPFRSLINGMERMFERKASKVVSKKDEAKLDPRIVERRKMLGTFAFVAVPVPLTGVWTGSAVAVFLELNFWKSLSMICLGNFVAGALITLLTYFLRDYVDLILYVLLGVVVIVLIGYIVKFAIEAKREKKNPTREENTPSPSVPPAAASEPPQAGEATDSCDSDSKKEGEEQPDESAVCKPDVKRNGDDSSRAD